MLNSQSATPVQNASLERTIKSSPPTVPPRPMYAAVVACRNALTRLSQRLAPAPVVLYERLIGTWHTEMIYAVARLGIADFLADGPKTADELAVLSDAHPDSLSRLMRSLVSVGIFDRDRRGRYRLNRLAEPLRRGQPGSLRDMVLYAGSKHSSAAWSRFHEVVQRFRPWDWAIAANA